MSLHEAISAKLSALHNELGDRYIEFISTIDGDTLQQLERVLHSNIQLEWLDMLMCARKTKPTVPLELTFVWDEHEHDMLIKHWIES